VIRFSSRARHTDIVTGDHDGGDAAKRRDGGVVDEDIVSVSVIGEPPPKEGGGR
jgi:hypothetical protein